MTQNPQRNIAKLWRRRVLVALTARTPWERPKNRGGNAIFKSDAPVMTAPQEVQSWRGKCLDISEVEQMRNRIKYITLCYQFTEVERHEVDPCGHCGARFYLEGLTASAALPQDGAHKSVKRESAVSVPPFRSSRR